MSDAPGGLRRRLAGASPQAFSLYAGAAAFLTYFCMYGFRKPFAVAAYEGQTVGPLALKDALVIAQVLGYTLSKALAVRYVSQLSRARRTLTLVGLIAASEVALALFAALPAHLKVIGIFLAGLPLGAVWGLVFSYLEGRRTSDFTGAALCCSFIVASGFTKATGQWWLQRGVSESWMPFITGLTYLVPFLLGAWLLHQIPPPSRSDEVQREARPPMDATMRGSFLRAHGVGLAPLLVMYFFLTALRDYRDNYAKEIWTEFGLGEDAAVYAVPEVSIAFVVLVVIGGVVLVRDNRRAMLVIYGLMTGGMLLSGVVTLLFDAGVISGPTWMTLVGLGLYLAYVPYNCVLFDRLIALLRSPGTAVFTLNLADTVGYTGSVVFILYRQFGRNDLSRYEFFHWMCYVSAILCTLCFAWSLLHFLRSAPRPELGS